MANEYASIPKRRKFFALVADLGYDADFMKDRVKKKFNLHSFKWITNEQISEVIGIMQDKLDKEYIPCPHCRGTGFAKKEAR